MKKVLLGLLALSAISMAAPPDLSGDGVPGTNVFIGGQLGEISVTGNITSEVPVVKYVIFAVDPGGNADSVLNLNDFILSQDNQKVGFGDAINPRVYVQRVVGGAHTSLTSSDVVSFKVLPDPFFNSIPNIDNWITVGSSVELQPTSLLSKAVLTEALADLPSDAGVATTGLIIRDSGVYSAYQTSRSVFFIHNRNGELKIADGTREIYSGYGPFSKSESDIVERYFAGGKAISNLKIAAKVD